MKKKILVAGVGNFLLKDEGVGIHIIKKLSEYDLPPEVETVEIGTATFELTRFIEGKDKVIIIDAILSDDAPGTIYKLTPNELKSKQKESLVSLHQFGVTEALKTASYLGIKPEVVIFGITPKDYKTFGTELTFELEEVIQKVIDEVLKEIENS